MAAAKIATNAVQKQQTPDALRIIADSPALRLAALDAVKFPKPILPPALADYAQTPVFAQSLQLERLQGIFQKIAKEAALTAYQPKALASVALKLKSVDVGFGARVMEQSLREPQVGALAEILVATARDQGLPDLALDETDDDDIVSSVQRTAVSMFVYLCGTTAYLVTLAEPKARDQIEILLALLAACYAAAKKFNGDR